MCTSLLWAYLRKKLKSLKCVMIERKDREKAAYHFIFLCQLCKQIKGEGVGKEIIMGETEKGGSLTSIVFHLLFSPALSPFMLLYTTPGKP